MVQHSYLGGNRRLEKRTIQEDKFIFILAFLDSDKVFYLFNCVLLFHEFLFVLGYFPPFSAGILILLCKKKKDKIDVLYLKRNDDLHTSKVFLFYIC